MATKIIIHDKIDRRRNTIEDFHDRIDKNSSECWTWLGNLDRDGYGRWNYNGDEWFVHRFSYQLYHGDLQEDLLVMHKCDNPTCCNPDHLKQGTYKENNVDCAQKGRKPKGVKNPNAKLTEYQVLKIRELNAIGISQEELSKIFNTSRRQIHNIIHRIHWGHLDHT
jgi:hypothetical protein